MIKQIIRNKTMKKQYKHVNLLKSCPKHEIYVNKQSFRGTKTRRFRDQSIENGRIKHELLHLSWTIARAPNNVSQ